MSDEQRVDHAAEAEIVLARADKQGGDDLADALRLEALVHATLAVAEQQRIANLLAVSIYDRGVLTDLILGVEPRDVAKDHPERAQIEDMHRRLAKSFLEIAIALGVDA